MANIPISNQRMASSMDDWSLG